MKTEKLLPKLAVEEYRKIYKKKFNVWLKFEEAELKANNFIQFLALVSRDKGF